MVPPTDDDRLVDSIYEALDRGDPVEALALAERGLSGVPDDPVLHFLSGVALLELDRPEKAVPAFRRAVEQDGEDPEFRSNLALALYSCCEFDEARAIARSALERDPEFPDAHHVLGLVLERDGRLDDADAAFDRAMQLDPEAFPTPLRLTRERFTDLVATASDRLPERFRRHLDEVAVTVEDLPAKELLLDEPVPLDPGLLGLFVGIPLTERSSFNSGGELPPRILLFQRNLERCFPERDRLADEITRTLYHELGHYLGMEEQDLEEVGFD